MERPRSSLISRISAVAVMLIVIALLATARTLSPSPLGYGTHQQLGLPPCTSVALLGLRCPACGMTTSWSYAMRGQWGSALNANAGGLGLVLIALAYIPAFCYYLARGYWSRHGWLSFSLALSLSAALLVAAGQWLTRLM
ncbi:MAG: DUF2752 domain-containing protein [Aureliella sp.]